MVLASLVSFRLRRYRKTRAIIVVYRISGGMTPARPRVQLSRSDYPVMVEPVRVQLPGSKHVTHQSPTMDYCHIIGHMNGTRRPTCTMYACLREYKVQQAASCSTATVCSSTCLETTTTTALVAPPLMVAKRDRSANRNLLPYGQNKGFLAGIAQIS